ncbi:hypothetical protein DPMN_097115 [Dreissena polymorpha]|uniref:EGF-like domain-containing protein n=1 Tax=Dreissena polymorpha TaxID=45954 RepID=A0A9D4L9P1_DREPO|nr:hypothetical protein DPMN_097115 [Dreissena polymorpha]
MPNGRSCTQIERIKDTNVLSDIQKRTQILRNVRRKSVKSIATILKRKILPEKRATLDSDTTHRDLSNYDLINNTQFYVSTISNIGNRESSKLYSKSLSHALKNPKAPVLENDISHSKDAEKRRRRSHLLGFGINNFLRNVIDNPRSEIVYGAHSKACDPVDQNYCLNGGSCIIVVPLNIKTCQCKVGFTGQRCQMWNQEYLLALLSQEIIG